MESIAGIKLPYEERLDVLKYRPGTFHVVHIDYWKESLDILDRHSQGSVFLTGTEVGGNFVMPLLGIAVKPKPGSLVIWYNENRHGMMDIRYLILQNTLFTYLPMFLV